MPIYVYRCDACGVVEEHIQRFSDPPLTVCESCGGRLEKQVTAAAFQLKGGGWYKDGYASAKADGGADKPAAPASTDSGSKAADSSGSGSKGASSAGSTGTTGSGTTGGGSTGSSASTAAE